MGEPSLHILDLNPWLALFIYEIHLSPRIIPLVDTRLDEGFHAICALDLGEVTTLRVTEVGDFVKLGQYIIGDVVDEVIAADLPMNPRPAKRSTIEVPHQTEHTCAFPS